MKKSAIASLFLLIIASPLVNAVTFEKISGNRSFYMPELSASMEDPTYEMHSYEIDFPRNGSKALQGTILKEVFGDNINPNDSFHSVSEDFLNSFLDEESYERPQLIGNVPNDCWVQEISAKGALKSQNANLIVYETSSYIYFAGAAHGMYGVSYLNYYTPINKALNISDILLISKTSLITKAIRRNAHKVADALYDSTDFSGIEYTETFYISNGGITFVYQPYEIGPYASGVIEITVPKSHLTGCLTPLGNKLIK